MAERVDAVVIGGGLGGLAAAVTLAGRGRRTLVLEQHSTPGGYASGFERGPYRFDTALHALNGLAPGGGLDEIHHQLGIWGRLKLHRLDPLYVLRGAGKEIVAHADWFGWEAELIRSFPLQADNIRACLDETLAVYRDSRRLEVDRATGREPRPEDLGRRYPALLRVSGETWDQMMARHVDDPQARAALAALWPYLGTPPSMLDAPTGCGLVGSYHEHGGWYPEGGAQAISRALVRVLRERGGEIRYGHLVTGLDLAGERAVALTTHEGLRLEADLFVSNASAPTTMLELVGRDHLPAEYVAAVESPTRASSTFSVYLGLDRDPLGEQHLPHELFVDPALDADAAAIATAAGDWAHATLLVTDYTSVDPGCAPRGHGVVVLTTGAAWDYENTWGTGGDLVDYHRNARYLELKERVADTLVARAADAVPGLSDSIRHREVSTPLTNFHYTRNPGGVIEGYANTLDNLRRGWLSQRTPVTNLFLAGAWTNTGGMNPAMASGLAAAHLALSKAAVPATAS